MSMFGNKDDAYRELLKTQFSYGDISKMQADFLKGKENLLKYTKIYISKDCWALLIDEEEVKIEPPAGVTEQCHSSTPLFGSWILRSSD